jgi:TonB-linked SusC/RagA family outer membrane protein
MRRTLLSLPIAVLALASHDVLAQARTVTGRVLGTDGAGLPGVTVVAKGTSQGTATDGEGRYTLSVPAGASTLVFSSVGFDSKEVAIGSQSAVNITLSTANTGLDEVVVVGYGTQSRRDLTGSVATIKGTELANKPVQSFEQALQGRAAGVNVTTPNGVLNNPPLIRVRGVSSISLSSSPLYVIDGIPAYSGNSSAVGSVPNNPLSNVNPSDIESVEVLKDASATAIYGSRAAGGVILVTTKKGRKGQSRISYDAWVGWSKPVRLYDLLGAQDYMNIKNEAVRNLNANRAAIGQAATNVEGFQPTLDANGNIVETNWYDHVYRTGFSSSNNVNFSGGSEKTNYYASVGYTDQKGMIEQNTFKRLSTRLNIDHKVYKSFSVGARIGYSNTRNAAPNTGSVADGAFTTGGIGRSPLVLPPNVSALNPDGSYNVATGLSNGGLGPGNNLNPATNTPLLVGYYNPIVDLENNYFRSDGNEVQGSVYANWEVIKGLNLRTSYGINNISFEDRSFLTPIASEGYVAPPGVGGSATNYYRTNKRWNWQNTAQYDRTFAEKHSISLLLGNEQQHTDIVRWGANRTAVADVFFDTFEGNFTNIAVAGPFQGENYLASFFGRLNYDFAKKYLLTVNARRDGYSAFANKWRNFYGASAGYVLSEEEFWKNTVGLNKLNFLKLTASYGNVGNGLGVDDFVALRLYGSGLYGANPTLSFSQPGNQDLGWETSKKTDFGLSFGALDDRLRGEFAYYRNALDGLILNVPQAPSRGIPGDVIPANVGAMRNTGIELSLSYNAIKTANFSWTVNGNITTLKNRVLTLATEGQRIGTATSGLETVNYTRVGGSVGELLAVRTLGVNPENGRRLAQLRNDDGTTTTVQYNHLSSVTGNGWTTLDGRESRAPNQLTDGEYFGPTLPKWYGGFDNTFTYKGFDLGIFIQYSGGNYIYNGTKSGLHDQRFWNNATDILDRWTPENTSGSWPRVVFGDNVSNGSALVISENIEKGDFARLRNVSLGYTVNSGLLNRYSVASARVYVQVQNAALVTNYSGIDPEISTNSTGTGSNTGSGVDRNSVGQARTYTVGLNIGF